MQFRDLKKQYQMLKREIDQEIQKVFTTGNFISGQQVKELEDQLAKYVGVKHCITCGNGTDALSLALMTWNIGPGDAVFVPDFTFFASGEVVAFAGATPIFIDVEESTFNISSTSLEAAIIKVKEEGKLIPKVIIAVDLFGQPANFKELRKIANKYNLFLLEDGAQGFGGQIGNLKSCSFGDISTTSFFPAKPLGCYGDGGAIFTNNDTWEKLIRSYCIHGKGTNKYDNVHIGINSRLDTIQAAILKIKLKAFQEYELVCINQVAMKYSEQLAAFVTIPHIKKDFFSSWAQYSILLKSEKERDNLCEFFKKEKIPSMIYYPKPMHQQKAFAEMDCVKVELKITTEICKKILSLPIHPYMNATEQKLVIQAIKDFFNK